MTRIPTIPAVPLAAAAAMLCLAAGAAWGQNALGDGSRLTSPLDRDLGRGVPRGPVNTSATFQQQINLRNAIVTGNTPNGTSFRGDVGYIAPTEFRGTLGSNDLFAFRRDSLFSGFAGMGIRGTESLQYQFALTTGSSARGVLGTNAVPRSGGGVGRQVSTPLVDPTVVTELRGLRDPRQLDTRAGADTDQGGSMMDMLRTPSAYTVNRGIQAELMSAFVDSNTGTSWGLTASALRGVRMSRLLDAERELLRPGALGTSAAPETAVTALQPEQASGVEGATRVPTLATPDSYQAMLERFRAAAEGRAPAVAPATPPAPEGPATTPPGELPPGVPLTPPTTAAPGAPDWESRLAEIRERLQIDVNPEVPGTNSAIVPQAGTPVPGLTPPPGFEEEGSPIPPPGAGDGVAGFRPLDPEVLRIIRENRVTISRYADAGEPTDAYAQHMARAGELMRSGAYFDAEERFTRAQAARRDDYLATVGRFHAQIGAGMFLSAGMNLRRLLTDHPEVAAARFDAAMLPSPQRLDQVVAELRANASKALEGQGVLLGTDSTLLLAYVAFQRGDAALLSEALDTYRRLMQDAGRAQAAEGETTRTHGAALLEMITAVWGPEPLESP